MAQIISGDNATFNALVYGQIHPGTQQFLYNQYQNPTTILTQAGQQFIDYGRQLHQQLAESRTAQYVAAVQRAVGSIWQADSIRYLETIGELQWAPLSMQRLIMAEPTVRGLYHQQRVEGYSGSYRDDYPDDVGVNHYDYRRATNGLVQWDSEGNWSATTYFDDLEPGDRDLTLLEQVDIECTWAQVRAHLRRGKEDPTSRWNASL
jgi:hypothetical protein